jgi:hypothetical protein
MTGRQPRPRCWTLLVAELRRQATATGEALPKTESLLTPVSRWVNNHQQPDGFYRDLLAGALDRPAAELFGDEDQAADLEAGAEPWRLARALELSSVGTAALEGIEAAVANFARRYPSTSLPCDPSDQARRPLSPS